MNFQILNWIYWNSNTEAFKLPFFQHSVRWYGLLFALGFVLGYWIFYQLILRHLQSENKAHPKTLALELTDSITWFVVGGTVIGARLGHILFYDWPRYSSDLLSILKIWEGGLASHGGVIGIMLALFFYKKISLKKHPEISYINLLDLLCIPTALAAFCIRLGNFVNQEILGTETTLPWAVIFGNPADHSPIVPRHPVQLYEGFFALLTFFILFTFWKKRPHLKAGIISGLFFILIFGSRFLFEFIKLPSSLILNESFIQTGQLLSLPCIALGFFLLFYGKNRVKTAVSIYTIPEK
ncbi:MAG TPA: prolipoprotein diacylglyceryl transferase [Parachlamydiaceae bacterium]|nr:prolipoprotein diacylglyceryl transferase [Parachlamydiaceae bacterium]